MVVSLGDAHLANESDLSHLATRTQRKTNTNAAWYIRSHAGGYHQATRGQYGSACSSLSPSYGGLNEDDRALSLELSQ